MSKSLSKIRRLVKVVPISDAEVEEEEETGDERAKNL